MEIFFSIVGKIGEYSVGPIGEQFSYIISYKNNISTLEEKILKLLEKEEAVQQSIDGAQWNQHVVASEVKTWKANVRKRIEEAHKFLEEDVKANRKCLNGWCPDLKLRYSLGKKAQKNTQAIIQLLEEGGKYDRVYNTLPPLEVRSSPTGWFKDFESRKSMILKGLGTVEQTRELVHTIVKNLIRSNLLLDSNWKERVKMHDVVRDVAIEIASRDENGFMVVLHEELEEWPQKDRYDSYTTISLLLGEMKWHPTELECPTLQLLQLSCRNHSKTFPDNLFDGMKELKMLSLQDCRSSLTTLPPSIQILQNLRMLNLQNCCLGDVSAIGTLGNLEILGFPYSEIEELPLEIGNLSRLKLLDMKGCRFLKRIAAGVLSGLSRLEELYVGGFWEWGCTTTMEGNGEVTNNNASLTELIPYSNQLVVLEINVSSILYLPKELYFSNSNFRFRIHIGIDYATKGDVYLFENTLVLEVEDASDLGEYREIRSLLKKAVDLRLDIVKNLKHIWFEKEQKGILPICSSEDLEYLLEATSDSTPPNTFHLLESLSLYYLPRLIGMCKSTDSVEITLTKEEEQNVSETENQVKMLSLFQYNMIESLENLEGLSIHRCDSLEVIFELEGLNAEESNIFNNLTVLSLEELPKLLHIWKKGPRDIKGFNYLRSLQVWDCDSLKCLFTPSIAKLLVKLEEIRVLGCNEMEEILGKELGDEENRDVIAFSLMKTLELGNLPKLECFYTEDNHAFEWPSLDKITIGGCPKLKMFVSTSTKTPKLKGVHTNYEKLQPMVEGDLNATIQHIIEGKGFAQRRSRAA